MKTNLHLIRILGVTGLLVASSPPGQADERRGFYFSGDVGGSWADNVSLKEFPGATPGGKVELTPGARLSLGGGFRACEWFRVGGEFGYGWNFFEDADGYLSQTPMMGVVEFQLPNRFKIVPFIGGGAGMNYNVIWLDDDRLGDGFRVDGAAGDTVFAWQAYGGLRYRINEAMSAGIIYRYLDSQSSEWDVDDTAQDIRFGKVHLHSISASFSMSF